MCGFKKYKHIINEIGKQKYIEMFRDDLNLLQAKSRKQTEKINEKTDSLSKLQREKIED